MNDLLTNRAAVVASIAGSTCSQDYPGLPAFVEQCLRTQAQRGEAAVQRSLERSASIRAGIVQAVGALPVDQWGVAGVVQRRIENRGPGFYGLQRVPDIGTIRSVLDELQIK